MPHKKFTVEYYDQLLEDYNQHLEQGGSVAAFASAMNIKESTLRGRLQFARNLQVNIQPDGSNPYFINFTLGEPLTLTGDWTIIGDIHAPFTHMPTVRRMLEIARRYMPRPRKLLLAGDVFNMDTFSHYPSVINNPTFGVERNYLRALFAEFAESFDEIVFIMGNHDRRIQKFTQGAFEETDILALITSNEKFHVSNFGWCIVQANGTTWRVTHPRSYSRNPLTVAGKLADLRGQNIISFHEHHLGKSYSAGGRIVVNGGCAVDPSKLAYVMLDDGLGPQMQNGFVTLRDGFAQEWGNEDYTDWGKWI